MDTKEQLRVLIRKIIKEEVREIVASEVNAVLAEKFVASIGAKQQNLVESVLPTPYQTVTKKQFVAPKVAAKPQISKEELRNRLLEKMGAKENPMMAMIYGDDEMINEATQVPKITANGFTAPASQPQQLSNGVIVDSDDEGVDITQFYK